MFSFFGLGCETSSPFHSLLHCVSRSFVCVPMRPPSTLKRSSSWYLNPIEDTFLQNTHTHTHTILCLSFSPLLLCSCSHLCGTLTQIHGSHQEDITENVSENTYITIERGRGGERSGSEGTDINLHLPPPCSCLLFALAVIIVQLLVIVAVLENIFISSRAVTHVRCMVMKEVFVVTVIKVCLTEVVHPWFKEEYPNVPAGFY